MRDLFSKKTGTIIVVFFCSFALVCGCVSDSDPRMFSSFSEYQLEILPSDTITNATFYIPLPVKNRAPMVGSLLLDKEIFEKENYQVEIVPPPPGMNRSGEYPNQDNFSWFLKITAEKISPAPENNTNKATYSIYIRNRTRINTPFLFINTIRPFGNESVFQPKMNFSPSTPVKTDRKDRIEYIETTDVQEIPVFAVYSTSPLTKVHIGTSVSGSNSWLQDSDSYGGNSYSDYYDWYHTGESNGWQTAKGALNAAHGVYPPLDLPEWQKFINQTAMK